jgi:CMP/dCMP kinase
VREYIISLILYGYGEAEMTYRTITIDGPAGSGKSTVAKEVARRLNYTFLDTGAIYRAAAVIVETAGCDIRNDKECASVLDEADIRITEGKIFANGRDVTDEIRSHHISELASAIAAYDSVREELLGIQRDFKRNTSLVAEGRDTGSVVFPDADIKFYLDATPEERARRRHIESVSRGSEIPMEQVLGDLERRDERDSTRTASPLTIPENSFVVDTTHLNFEEVVEKILSIIHERLTD